MKQRIIVIAASVLFLCSVFLLINATGSESGRLSQEQIAALRVEYPLQFNIPPMISMAQPTLSRTMEGSETMAYAKVLSEVAPYEMDFLEGDILRTFDFFGYRLEIMSDSAGMLKKGTEITVYANMLLENLFPALREGMEIAVPIGRVAEWDGAYGFSALGMFYITPDGHALSVRGDMEDALEKDGLHVNSLLDDMRQMKERQENKNRS
jgi:hypothetical protein